MIDGQTIETLYAVAAFIGFIVIVAVLLVCASWSARSLTAVELNYRDVIYNRNNYVADGQQIVRVRLEVVTQDGNMFWVHAHDHQCQERRIKRRSEQ